MSVSTVESGVIRIGNGVTTVFSFSFEAGAAADIKVSNIIGVALVPVVAGFTVALNPDGTGGTVTFSTAPANLQSFYIYRETAQTQNVSVSSQQAYDPRVAEQVWDKLTFLIQELSDQVSRSVLTAPGTDASELVNTIVVAAAAVTAGNVGLAPNGTVASPGYAFVSEPSLGFLRASAGLLQAAVGGAARLELSATALRMLVAILSTNGTLTAGTNAQGQGAITTDQVTVTSTPNNPSGVTLPIAVAGRRIIVANRGTNPINIYPASGGSIGNAGLNNPVSLAVGQVTEFFARTATQWEGQLSQPIDAKLTQLLAPTYVRGDLIRRGASVLERLPIAPTAHRLASDGTDALWLPEDIFFRLESAHVGANVTTQQNVFPKAVTLDASSVYEYEFWLALGKTVGATLHGISIGFGGTHTLNNIIRHYTTTAFNSAATESNGVTAIGYLLVSTMRDMTGATFNTAVTNFYIRETGTISVNTGGTWFPAYQLSAAPGGAWSTQPGSFCRLRKKGASGANIGLGAWA